MRKQDLKMAILKTCSGREFYGYEIHTELSMKNIKVRLYTLYRVLNEMLKEGYLVSRWEKSRIGPQKRVYQVSQMGKDMLNIILLDAIETIHGFYMQYMLNLPPAKNVFDNFCRLFVNKSERQGNIAFITSQRSLMAEGMLHAFHNRAPHWDIFLINPQSETINLNLDNLTTLQGTYKSIPLKDEYVKVLVIVVPDMSKEYFLKTTLTEWRRVLSQNGKLAILTPTVLIKNCKDPLTIGDFIEEFEHKTIEKGETVDGKIIKRLLKNFFQNVEKRRIATLTILLASKPFIKASYTEDSLYNFVKLASG